MLRKIMKIIWKIIKWVILMFIGLLILLILYFVIRYKYFPFPERPRQERGLDEYTKQPNKEDLIYKRGAWKYHPKYGTYSRDLKIIEKSTGMVTDTGENTDQFKSYRTKCIYQLDPVVYIGEWEYDKQIKKNIRLIKRQQLQDGVITSTYETMDERNKDIPPMKWSPIRKINDSFNFDNNPPEDIQLMTKEENDKVREKLRAEGYIVSNNDGIIKDGKTESELEPEEIEVLNPRQQ